MRNGLSLGACNAHIQELSRRLAPYLMRGVFGSSRAPDAILPRTGIDQILICRFQHRLGDSIALTPLLEELATVFPGAKVDIITAYPAAQAVYGSFGNIRSTFLLPAHVPGHLLRTVHALHSMRRRHYDLAIDPDLRSQSSRLLALNAHADRRLGFVSPHKSGTLSHGVAAAGAPSHRATTACYLVRTALGEDPMRRAYPAPRLGLGEGERAQGRSTLAHILGIEGAPAPVRCIGLFANGTRGRSLGGDWWQRFLAAFEPQTTAYRLIEILPAPRRSPLQGRYPGFHCADVRKLAAVIASLSLYISADCGLMHLAWAAGAPTVGLFNVTEPGVWGPWGEHNRALDVRGTTPELIALDVAKVLDTAPSGRSPLQKVSARPSLT